MKFTYLLMILVITLASCDRDPDTTVTPEFFKYTLDGTNYSVTMPSTEDSLLGTTQPVYQSTLSKTYLNWYTLINKPGGIYFGFRHASPISGIYKNVYLTAVKTYTVPDSTIQVNLTNFATAMGQYYEGNFAGQFSENGNTHTINGEFRIKRDQH